jgi:antitoxin HicB
LRRTNKDGGFVVTFRDIPEAITQGDAVEACREEAAGALQAALEGRIMSDPDIPKASKLKQGEQSHCSPGSSGT